MLLDSLFSSNNFNDFTQILLILLSSVGKFITHGSEFLKILIVINFFHLISLQTINQKTPRMPSGHFKK